MTSPYPVLFRVRVEKTFYYFAKKLVCKFKYQEKKNFKYFLTFYINLRILFTL